MSLPTLTTAGASYVGAWRAQDALRDGDDYIISVPSALESGGGDLLVRSTNGATWSGDPSEESTYVAAGTDGLPAIRNTGVAGQYCTEATLLAAAQGAKLYQTFIRGEWPAADAYNLGCGYEAWLANEVANFENAGFFQVQLDRGQSRRTQGSVTWAAGVYSWNNRVDTEGNMSLYRDDGATPEVTMSFSATVSSWSAFAIGPVQRSAGSDFPPGIWTTNEPWIWGRCVVVACGATFLNETDEENIRQWLEGHNFGPTPPSGGRRIIRYVRPVDSSQRPSYYRLP